MEDKKEDKNGEKNKINEEFEVKDSDFDNFPQDYNPEEEYDKKQLVSDIKNPSQHESLVNSNENKLNNTKEVEDNKEGILPENKLEGDEHPILREHSNFKEKRTSAQIFRDNSNDENNENLKPESMKQKMILDE